jgi:hypothetical protein
MALLENRTGASVNPGNRQDNAQIVVFVATKLTMVARPAASIGDLGTGNWAPATNAIAHFLSPVAAVATATTTLRINYLRKAAHRRSRLAPEAIARREKSDCDTMSTTMYWYFFLFLPTSRAYRRQWDTLCHTVPSSAPLTTAATSNTSVVMKLKSSTMIARSQAHR